MKKIKIKLKPVGIDAHLKYRCPRCDLEHWVSLKEAQTKNFIVVCDCKKRFFIQTVKQCKIIFRDRKKKSSITESTDSQTNTIFNTTNNQSNINLDPIINTETDKPLDLPEHILSRATKILVSFGFTLTESKEMLKQEYLKNPTEDYKLLIKNCISNLER